MSSTAQRSATNYLQFVQDTVQLLLECQTARIGGALDGALCITVTRHGTLRWRSIGPRSGDSYENFLIEAQPLEEEPYRLDFAAWPVLELLSELTGDAHYRALALAMARAFAEHGFHPRSGLPFFGAQAEFDVLRLTGAPINAYDEPVFKPAARLPLETLWAIAPARMARMAKAVYYGLVTRPETLDYNRYCTYDFDDAERRHVLSFASNHRAFALSGIAMIHYWSLAFARTGDRECLAWARQMADKWRAAQHVESGLIPHFFGTDLAGEEHMPPYPLATPSDTHTALMALDVAGVLRGSPDSGALAEAMADFGLRALRGIARYGYDEHERRFPNWLTLDGREYTGHAFYAFRTQAQKDEAVKLDPILEEVAVFSGHGFFTGDPWSLGMSNPVPLAVARGARCTGDAELLDRAVSFDMPIMSAARALTGACNARGQWTYTESASYIEFFLLLHRLTGKPRYLDYACELAEREIALLSQPLPPGAPDWWRFPFRNVLLRALLRLSQALASGG